MPYFETDPYAIEISKHILKSIDIRISENIHRVTVESYDRHNVLIKTDVIDIPVFDINKQIIMPVDWPVDWPSGENLYMYMEQAFYKRLHESHKEIIGEGFIA